MPEDSDLPKLPSLDELLAERKDPLPRSINLNVTSPGMTGAYCNILGRNNEGKGDITILKNAIVCEHIRPTGHSPKFSRCSYTNHVCPFAIEYL